MLSVSNFGHCCWPSHLWFGVDKLDPHRADPTLNSNRIFCSSFANFFDTILARGFCLAFLGEANGKHAEHVIVSCLHIHMNLNEGPLSLRVDLEDTLEGSFSLRRFWIAAKSPSAASRAHPE